MCDSGNPFKCSCILGIYNDWNFPVFFLAFTVMEILPNAHVFLAFTVLETLPNAHVFLAFTVLETLPNAHVFLPFTALESPPECSSFFVFQESCTFGKFLTTRNCHISWNKERLWNTTRNVVFLFHFIVISCTGNLPFFQVNLLKSNMDSGTNVYFSRVNKVIHLFKGADSSWHQKIRDCLPIFLKGTKKKKAKLMIDHPNEY